MAVMNSREEARNALLSMTPGNGVLDFAYSNGLLQSSKELYRIGEDEWHIFHGIDGSVTAFNLEHAIEVLLDERSAWEGTPELNEED